MANEMKDICECDVGDKERLAVFRQKIRTWRQQIEGKHRNAIWKQVAHLLWYDTVFRTFNEARKLSKETDDSSVGLPRTIIELFDEGFVAYQVMAIRRLSDPYRHDPQRRVYSLRSLVQDIEAHIGLYTRENYVCYDGLPYKAPDDEKEHQEWSWRQDCYDRLSGKKRFERARADRIAEEVWDRIKEGLDKEFEPFKGFREYANKYLAHASDPERRKKRKKIDREFRITLQTLDKCYQAIGNIGKKIELLTGENLLCQVPTPQFDQLKNWDKRIIRTEDRSSLYEYWRNRAGEVEEMGRYFGEDAEWIAARLT